MPRHLMSEASLQMQCFEWPELLLLCLGSQMPRHLTSDVSQKNECFEWQEVLIVC